MSSMFNGNVALITGGSSGIGRATALAFAREAAKVVVASRRSEQSEETVRDTGHINAVAPAVIRTEMTERAFFHDEALGAQVTAMHPMGRVGKPEEVAEAVLFLCSKALSFTFLNAATPRILPLTSAAGRMHARRAAPVPLRRAQMNKITKSGIYYEESGQLMLVTQGLGGYTLVANKKILFRLYMDLSATRCVTVLATVTYKLFGFRIKKSFVIPTESLLIESAGLLGDSVGILFTGEMFPFPSPVICSVEFDVFGNPSSVPHFEIKEMVFLMPGRLRLMIHNLSGTAPWGTTIVPNFSWLVDMFQALERLSAMMPIRDGVKLGLTHADAGLCYVFGENLDPWPAVCPSGGAPPCDKNEMYEVYLRETNEINASGTAERVDATVVWRPRDLLFPASGGESVGGKAINYNSPPGTGLAGLVGGNLRGKEFTGAILAQEIGHLFGLEPKESPHFDDPLDGRHSKDRAHNDPFAFDFYLLQPYQPPVGGFLGDVMNNTGGGVGQGRDMVLYNAFDWEHLRQKFVKLPGVARSAASARRPSKEAQKEMTTTLNASLANATEIKVDNPAKALPTRQGYAWHWTGRGFQPAARGAKSKSRSGLAPSVEGIRSWLHDRGVTKFYVPVGDRSLPMVINPNAHTTLDRKGFSDRNGL